MSGDVNKKRVCNDMRLINDISIPLTIQMVVWRIIYIVFRFVLYATTLLNRRERQPD